MRAKTVRPQPSWGGSRFVSKKRKTLDTRELRIVEIGGVNERAREEGHIPRGTKGSSLSFLQILALPDSFLKFSSPSKDDGIGRPGSAMVIESGSCSRRNGPG